SLDVSGPPGAAESFFARTARTAAGGSQGARPVDQGTGNPPATGRQAGPRGCGNTNRVRFAAATGWRRFRALCCDHPRKANGLVASVTPPRARVLETTS